MADKPQEVIDLALGKAIDGLKVAVPNVQAVTGFVQIAMMAKALKRTGKDK